MIVHYCEQGSPEWHEIRAGVITASMFSLARKRVGGLTEQQTLFVNALRAGQSDADAMEAAGYKSKPKRTQTIERAIAGERVGDFSDEAKNYAFRLAVERISCRSLDDGFETWAMRRGRELEPAARAAHELAAGVVVDPCGFITTDDGAFGASADGLIGEKGGSEYKCLVSPERLRAVLIDEDLSEFADQVQGGLWLSGREFWHFGQYCPALESIGLDFWWREWRRDENYIEALEEDLLEFKSLVDSMETKLRAVNGDGGEYRRAA